MAARRTTRDGIICGEVDGVPAFWPPTREGPAAALLMFRVGQADETLPSRGITHLIEHLALVPTGRAPHDFNGQTGSSITSFGVVGQPGELVGFFDVLASSLRALPVDRLASERTVLQTEEQSRAHSSQAALGDEVEAVREVVQDTATAAIKGSANLRGCRSGTVGTG